MIKFFRHIRKGLIETEKTTRYFKYAIGEIVLVVIGILIALSINNWNENQINKKKETIFLMNFKLDLNSDLEKLKMLEKQFERSVNSKKVFEEIYDQGAAPPDSLGIHYVNQYSIISNFQPNTITISELKNSGGINLISNAELRRQLVSLYNSYDNLISKYSIGLEKAQSMINYSSAQFEHVLKPTEEEIGKMLEDKIFKNQMRANFLYTQLEGTVETIKACELTLKMIEEELQ